MPLRRAFVEYIALLGVGAGGYALFADDIDVPDISGPDIGAPKLDGSSTTPAPDRVILETELSQAPFEHVTFYESGKAEVLFTEDHNIDQFGFTHAALQSPEDHFNVWDTPRFQGPKTTNLKRVVVNNGPYPENAFVFGVHYDASSKHYIGPSPPEFRVPTPWYSAANEE